MVKYKRNKGHQMKYSIRYKIAKIVKKVGANFDASKNPAVQNMKDCINNLPDSGIQFIITREPNGNWVAESVNIAGILTGGSIKDDVDEMIKDAIFTYFEVPAKYCDDSLIRSASEPVTIKQEVFATA